MSHPKSIIQLMRKTSLILLLILTLILILHLLITIFICTSSPSRNPLSSTFDAVLLVFLYYVIPMIILFCFYLVTNRLAHLELAYLEKKKNKKHARNKIKPHV